MKKNSTKLFAGIIISLVIGYLAGSYIGIPGVDPSLLNGDLSKAKQDKELSEAAKVFQDRMEKDSTFRDETLASLAIVDERVNQFNELTVSTATAAKDIKELQQSVAQITDLQSFAQEAKAQADSALIMLCNMANGTRQTGTDYEQLANNTFIAYTLMDTQKEVARQFVEQVDKYLYNNSKNEALTKVRNQWVAFCGDGAVLSGNKEETAYWDKKAMTTTPGAPAAKQTFGLVFNIDRGKKAMDHANKILNNNGVDAAQLDKNFNKIDSKSDVSANILTIHK